MSAPHVSRILNDDATSRVDRLASAPAPGAVDVDGRSLAELLAFGAQYGALITFYDLENQVAGNWSEFFASDPAIAQALHVALDLPQIESVLQSLLAEVRGAQNHAGRIKNLRRILAMIARLLSIHDRTQPSAGEAEAMLGAFKSTGRRDGLADPLQRFQRHMGGKTLEAALGKDVEGGNSPWGNMLADILDDIVLTLLAELRSGSAAALAKLDLSLKSAGHAPQAALYNAFILLFVEARKTLNQFPRRLVDFYYGTILKQHSRAAEPDQLFLTFTPAQAANQASVPRGALFPAGTDGDGKAINYAATSSLEVTPAIVTELSVHRVTDPTTDPASGEYTPQAVLSGIVALDSANPDAIDPFPMFGLPVAGDFGPLTMLPATIGFCVSSPALMLTGGERTIEIGLVLTIGSVTKLAQAAQLSLAAIGSVDFAGQVQQWVEQAFALHYSTAGGWMTVERFTATPVRLDSEGYAANFILAFSLPDDAPPLVPLADKPAPGAQKPDWPVDAFSGPQNQPSVVGSLKPGIAHHAVQKSWDLINQYAALSELEISEIFIDVRVEGLTDLTLANPNGPADTSQNFAVFGLPPAQFSTLDIYTPELFVKTIDTLSVAISWAGLPVTSTGFQGYYQGYVLDADGVVAASPLFDNTSFKAVFSVANPGLWDTDDKAAFDLFQTGPALPSATDPAPPSTPPDATTNPITLAAGRVLRTSRLTASGMQAKSEPPYYDPTTSSVRLSLVGPEYAFGNILYSNNLMAASSAQTRTVGDKARVTGTAPGGVAQLANLAAVNANAPDKSYIDDLGSALGSAISALTGEALNAVKQAIGLSDAAADTQAGWRADLDTALADLSPKAGSWWDRLTKRGNVSADAVAVLNNLKAWLAAHEPLLGAQSTAPVGQAHALLGAADTVAATHAAVIDQPPASARPKMAATLQDMQTALAKPVLPNPPWLPMASAISLGYTASARFPIHPSAVPGNARTALAEVKASGKADDPPPLNFLHIGPFGKLSLPGAQTGGGASLLPPVDPDAALYIQLSAPVKQVSLLFILAAGPNGWWDGPPDLVWEQHIDGLWKTVIVLDDTTNGLANSGIVTLEPDAPDSTRRAPRLRVRALGDTQNAPCIQAVVANALAVTWDGPGGAAGLGTPLPAKTISKSLTSLSNIGSIDQPMQSFGGRPPATGAAFQMWMAERLRHKNFGIDAWDYARIVLEAIPSLWQVAVVPATDESTGRAAPGKVWIVAIAGPDTPNILDTTMPLADLATLASIGDTLAGCISPFIELRVTNPPYLRLKVTAEVRFCDDDTAAFWEARLNEELIAWLSPWPNPLLGDRPVDYYSRRAVSEFIRGRDYVLGIVRFDIRPEKNDSGVGWYYLTSATKHAIKAPRTSDSVADARIDGSLHDRGTAAAY